MTQQQDRAGPRGDEQGVALVVTILVLSLVSVLLAGFVTLIVSDQRASGVDRDQTQAYGAAMAGLEKFTSDLSGLFSMDFSPSAAQVNALAGGAPVLPGFQFLAPDGTSGYTIAFAADAQGNPAAADLNGTAIMSGPFQGFSGIITPYTITVTARSTGGAEARLRRTLQTVGIPVFQFGMFSETDLALHAGETFNFGGRVHTNGNLYLSEGNGVALTLSDRVTAVKEVIRSQMSNGVLTSNGYNGTVNVATSASTFRDLTRTEGSFVPGTGAGTGLNGAWTALSIGTYSGYIRNGLTGARRLDLPLVSQGAVPVDLIRRPAQSSSENTVAPLVFAQRYFGQASLRILLSDTRAEITSLPTATAVLPVALDSGTAYATTGAAALKSPLAISAGYNANGNLPANIYLSDPGQPLLNGFIKIDMQKQNGAWQDVTSEILSLGITGRDLADTTISSVGSRWNTIGSSCAEPNPNAVIRLQRVRDVPVKYQPCGVSPASGTVTAVTDNGTDYWPNTLYDPREGQLRDGLSTSSTDIMFGGIMHYAELDVNNLRRWLLGQIGTSGTLAKNDNGFIVYFSDRRNNKTLPTAAGVETGQYGWEDIVNPASTAGTPNGVLDKGEDLDGSGALQVYGRTSRNVSVGYLSPNLTAALATDSLAAATAAWGQPQAFYARANRALFFRRALKIVNGGLGNIIAPGLTIASENPVYIQGNYNATSASVTATPHVAAAIVADAVTLLSNNWNDVQSFIGPADVSRRDATTTGYRMAVIAGKGLTFPQPGYGDTSFGSDGGAHNFMRYLEDWGGNNVVHRYRGSLVSFFISRQAVGTWKCCSNVYLPPFRDWSFDTDFLSPALLPPGTPMFRDVNTLTFRQLLRPNQ